MWLDIGVNIDLASLPALLVFWVGPGCSYMVVVLLVVILLPGLTVMVFCFDLLLFLIPCIGLLVPMTLVISESRFWSF